MKTSSLDLQASLLSIAYSTPWTDDLHYIGNEIRHASLATYRKHKSHTINAVNYGTRGAFSHIRYITHLLIHSGKRRHFFTFMQIHSWSNLGLRHFRKCIPAIRATEQSYLRYFWTYHISRGGEHGITLSLYEYFIDWCRYLNYHVREPWSLTKVCDRQDDMSHGGARKPLTKSVLNDVSHDVAIKSLT